MYNLSMFGTKFFAVTINYDAISIQATESLGKCGRTVFKIVSPTDDFETIKNGITLVATFSVPIDEAVAVIIEILHNNIDDLLKRTKLTLTDIQI